MVGAFVIKPPIIAYVTWETVGGRHSCLREYPKSLLTYAFMHPAKKLRGHRLVVRPAPSPASLAWEHIGTPWYLVKLLEVAFGLLAGVFIVIPLVLIHIGRKLSFSANGYDFTWYDQNDVLEVDRITKSCAVNPIPSLAFLTSLNDTSVLPSTHCICSWMSPADSSQGMCAGWHQSVTIQAIGVVSVSAY